MKAGDILICPVCDEVFMSEPICLVHLADEHPGWQKKGFDLAKERAKFAAKAKRKKRR